MKTPNGVNVGLDYGQQKCLRLVRGVNVGLDYGQQKCLRLVRGGTGKIKRHGRKGKMELNSFGRMGKQQKEGIKELESMQPMHTNTITNTKAKNAHS